MQLAASGPVSREEVAAAALFLAGGYWYGRKDALFRVAERLSPGSVGKFSERALETAAFTVFLYGRMLGCAAEIDDHLNRGKNMDTRTPQADIRFVA